MQGPVKGEAEGTVLQQPPGRVTQGRGLCASLTVPCLRDPACPQGFSWEEETMEQGHNCFIFFLKELVQRRTGLCLLLLLVNYLGC